MSAQVSAFSDNCDLDWSSRPFKLVSNKTVQSCLSSYQVWKKLVNKSLYMQTNVKSCPLFLSVFLSLPPPPPPPFPPSPTMKSPKLGSLLIKYDKMSVRFFRLTILNNILMSFLLHWLPRWPSGKASASRAEGPGFESHLRRDFFGVESYQWLKNWHSSGYPARRLVL